MHRSARLAVAATAVLGVGIGTAAVATATSRPTALISPAAARTAAAVGSTGAGGGAAPAGRGRHGDGDLFARADHATAEVRRDGSWVTITLDRGTVTAVSPTSITLARPDGASVTIALSPSTKFRGVASAQAVATGKQAGVRSEGGTAIVVTQRPPKQAAPTTSTGA